MKTKQGDDHDHGHVHGASCEHDHGHEHGEEEDDLVTLVDPDGEETDYLFLGTVEVDGDVYALLTPAVEEDPEGENTDVFVFHYQEDEDGAESYEAVEDDAILAKVQAAAEKLFEEAAAEE